MFKVGQRIVCKDSSGLNPLVKGIIYTVDTFGYCPECGLKCVILNEIRGSVSILCDCGKTYVGDAMLRMSRFEPLKYDLISNKDVIKAPVDSSQIIPAHMNNTAPVKLNTITNTIKYLLLG